MGAWAGVAHIVAQRRPSKVQHFRQLVVLDVQRFIGRRPVRGRAFGASFVPPPHRPLLVEHVVPDRRDLCGREARCVEGNAPRLFELAHAVQVVTLLRSENLEHWSIVIVPGRASAVWAEREAHERTIARRARRRWGGNSRLPPWTTWHATRLDRIYHATV